MTKIFLNSKQELIRSYPNYIPYSKNKICKTDGHKYEKLGTDQISHGSSWKLKHLVLSIATAALAIFLIPLAFKTYSNLLSKLWNRSTTGHEKLSLYVLIPHQVNIQKVKNEIEAFDQDQNLMHAFQDLEHFLSNHENDVSKDLSLLNLDQLENLKQEIFANKAALNEKSQSAFLFWPGVREFSTKFPNIWTNSAKYDLTLNDREVIENCSLRHKRYDDLNMKSQKLDTAYSELLMKILEKKSTLLART